MPVPNGELTWPQLPIHWDPGNKGTFINLSGGLLTAANTTNSQGTVLANVSKTAGQWYWELTINSLDPINNNGGIACIALDNLLLNSNAYNSPNRWAYVTFALINSYIGNNGGLSAYGTPYAPGNILNVALDATGHSVNFGKNNTYYGAVALPAGTYWPACGTQSAGNFNVTANFGATPFTYTPPAGYIALTP